MVFLADILAEHRLRSANFAKTNVTIGSMFPDCGAALFHFGTKLKNLPASMSGEFGENVQGQHGSRMKITALLGVLSDNLQHCFIEGVPKGVW